MGKATIGTRSGSRSTLSNSTSGSACEADVTNLIMALNPTSLTAPQLQPPSVPPLHLQSTLLGRVGGHPELLSLSPPRLGVSPMSTRSGRSLARSSSPTTSSNWQYSMSSTNTSTNTFTRYGSQSMRSVSMFATSVLPHLCGRAPTGAIPGALPLFLQPGFICPFEQGTSTAAE